MTQVGRNWLLRVEIRCAEQWGIALWEMENEVRAPLDRRSTQLLYPNEVSKPFGSVAWHMAIGIVRNLRINGVRP